MSRWFERKQEKKLISYTVNNLKQMLERYSFIYNFGYVLRQNMNNPRELQIEIYDNKDIGRFSFPFYILEGDEEGYKMTKFEANIKHSIDILKMQEKLWNMEVGECND